MSTTLHLFKDMFSRERRLVLEHGAIRVHAFKYASGIEALEISTGAARFTLLPFKGQQIWDAWVGDRRLTMQSVFDAPIDTREFRKTYGAFFVHCGGTAIGSPQAGEHHLPHGELPNIPFDRAHLLLGTEDGEHFVESSGVASDREAFSHAFEFRPTLRFFEGRADVYCTVTIENVGGDHMPCMYLGHVNFAPVPAARLSDGGNDAAYTWAKPSLPSTAPQSVHDWHDRVSSDFSQHRLVGTDDRVEPEFVKTLKLPSGADGWTHSAQLLADGSADFVSWQPADLPYAVRWITRASERQAMGFALPATAGPEGREAARQKGDLFYLDPGGRFTTQMRFGALRRDEANQLLQQIT
ncbi:DUF4432 family protein [Arvimicrobium flavum]|uniref:DUF4432 family protein n=1 Tax=Arvimicrobium flavum TaxID=3393320 RepID=UPI00237C407A|nr:DUF4432 family protein [Mesorhizobium shangrilense]